MHSGEGSVRETIRNHWGDRIQLDFPSGKTIKAEGMSISRQHLSSLPSSGVPAQKASFRGLRTYQFSEKGRNSLARALAGNSPDGRDFELLGTLGQGGMGIIYTAQQFSIDREIAVKMLKPELQDDKDAAERFLIEAQVTGKLDHPNIVPLHELGVSQDNRLFIAMKKVKGSEWSNTLSKKSLKENLTILLRICDATAFAHSKQIIHRDLKPENVMLGEFGEVILMDWGLSAIVTLKADGRAYVDEPVQAGTPAYMPPEVALCNAINTGFRTDVYLLGGILYEICTGLEPHTGKDVYDCLEAAGKNIIQPTERKDELIDIAMKAMATDPMHRFPSVKEFQVAVHNYLFHLESLALTNSAKEDLRKAGNDYTLLSRSLTLFEEAVKLWPENEEARKGTINARKIYASISLARGDLDLGKSLVFPDIPEHRDIYEALQKSLNERVKQALRTKLVGYGALALILVTLAILLFAQSKMSDERDLAIQRLDNWVDEREKLQATMGSLKKELHEERALRLKLEATLENQVASLSASFNR